MLYEGTGRLAFSPEAPSLETLPCPEDGGGGGSWGGGGKLGAGGGGPGLGLLERNRGGPLGWDVGGPGANMGGVGCGGGRY